MWDSGGVLFVIQPCIIYEFLFQECSSPWHCNVPFSHGIAPTRPWYPASFSVSLTKKKKKKRLSQTKCSWSNWGHKLEDNVNCIRGCLEYWVEHLKLQPELKLAGDMRPSGSFYPSWSLHSLLMSIVWRDCNCCKSIRRVEILAPLLTISKSVKLCPALLYPDSQTTGLAHKTLQRHIFKFSPELCFSPPFYSWTFNARKSSNRAINQKRGLHKQPVMTRVLNWKSLKRCGYMWSRLFKMNVQCLHFVQERIYEKSLCKIRRKRVFNQLWTETIASRIELYSYTATWFFWWGIMNKLGP